MSPPVIFLILASSNRLPSESRADVVLSALIAGTAHEVRVKKRPQLGLSLPLV